jgi:hypothetical protein
MVVEGPNCLGLVNYVDRIPLTFVETNAVPPAGKRAVGIVSQSGAMAAVLGTMLLARNAAFPIRCPPATRRRAAWKTSSIGWSTIPIPTPLP